jgi:hypothetical protein
MYKLKNGRRILVPTILITPIVFWVICAIVALILQKLEAGNTSECGKIATNFTKSFINTTSVGSLTGVYTCDFGELTEWSKAIQLFVLIPFCWLLQSIITVSIFRWRKSKWAIAVGVEFEQPTEIELVGIEVERFCLGVITGSLGWFLLDLIDTTFETPGPWWNIPGVAISIEANDGVVPWVGNFTNLATHPQFLIWASILLLYFGFPSPVCHRIGKSFYKSLGNLSCLPIRVRAFFRRQSNRIPELACSDWSAVNAVLIFTLLLAFPSGMLGWLIQSLSGTSVPFWSGVFDFSLTTRTAGFNSLDTGSLFWLANLIAWINMFIGTFPGGTGGRTAGPMWLVRIVEILSSKNLMTPRAREYFQWRFPWVLSFLFFGLAGLVIFNEKLTGTQLVFILISMSSNVGLDMSGTVQNFTNIQNIIGAVVHSCGYFSIGGLWSILHIRPVRMMEEDDSYTFGIKFFGKSVKIRFGSGLVN